jgi:hypothetical protein
MVSELIREAGGRLSAPPLSPWLDGMMAIDDGDDIEVGATQARGRREILWS